MFGMFKRRRAQSLVMTVAMENGPTFQTQAGETVLNGALRHEVDFPFSCKVGGCGTCKCQLLSGQVRELTDKSYLLSKEELQANFILGCQSIPRTDIQIRVPANQQSPPRFRGEVVRQLALTHDIVEVFVHLEQPLTYRSGQYTLLQPEAGAIPARCYSFAHHAPTEGTQDVSFFVRRVPDGRLSHWIGSAAALHQPVTLTASQGDFYLRSQAHKLLCIAGGSGLAPLVALLEGALKTSARQQDVLLMMGARRQRDLYYLTQIEQLRVQWQGAFSFVPVLSDEPAGSDWTGLQGMVTDPLSAEMVPRTQAYLCGPPPMIDAAIARLCTLGMNEDQIFSDKFTDQHKPP